MISEQRAAGDWAIRSIIILGGGSAGWMAAAALAHALRNRPTKITVIASPEIGTIGVGESTTAAIRPFHDWLEIDPDDFMRKTQSIFKLGVDFQSWGRIGESYFHPFGQYGTQIGKAPFYQYWLRMHALGDQTPLAAYSLTATAAKLGRFIRPVADKDVVIADMMHAYHLDAGLYGQYMREYAEARGVVCLERTVKDVKLRSEDGFIKSLVLDGGEEVEADFFFDCSGFRGVLIEGALKTGYENWTHWLPCDRAVAVPCEGTEKIIPYTRATARKGGWQWRVQLQNRTGNGYVFCSEHLSEDEAVATVMRNLDGQPLADPRVLRFTTGRRNLLWNKNCIALGLASGFLEPLEATALHLVMIGVNRLLNLYPDRNFNQAEIDEYNREAVREWEQVRDFLILHYCVTERQDSGLWRYLRNMELPDTLTNRIETFLQNGWLMPESHHFGHHSWVTVLTGKNMFPLTHDPLAEDLSIDEIREALANARRVVRQTAEAMPTHEQYIFDHCKAA